MESCWCYETEFEFRSLMAWGEEAKSLSFCHLSACQMAVKWRDGCQGDSSPYFSMCFDIFRLVICNLDNSVYAANGKRGIYNWLLEYMLIIWPPLHSFSKPPCHLVDKGKDYIELGKGIYFYCMSEVMCHHLSKFVNNILKSQLLGQKSLLSQCFIRNFIEKVLRGHFSFIFMWFR